MSTKKKRTHDYVVQDKYFHEAKKLGYRARSAFKLIEIQEATHLLKPGMKVFDLASFPGSFLQVIAKAVGEEGFVVGMDLQPIKPLGRPNVRVFQGDVFEFDKVAESAMESYRIYRDKAGLPPDYGPLLFDLFTSDIAPNTSGMTGVDQYRSIELNIAILDIADRFLKPGGSVLLKVFVGEDVDELVRPIKARYAKLQRFKPKACRDRSFEEYFLCIGKK